MSHSLRKERRYFEVRGYVLNAIPGAHWYSHHPLARSVHSGAAGVWTAKGWSPSWTSPAFATPIEAYIYAELCNWSNPA